ncbi:exported hypothetical protein [Gammaproteobacteria bacterium]
MTMKLQRFHCWLLSFLLVLATLPAFAITSQVGAGAEYSLALQSDGTLLAWGSDATGQLGTGRAFTVAVPQALKDLSLGANVHPGSLTAGAIHTLVRSPDGQLWTWGLNGNGQLGDGTNTNRSTPAPLKTLGPVTAQAGGYWHSLAATQDGKVWAWGDNQNGQLGDGSTNGSNKPVLVSGLTTVSALAAGDYHSLALKPDGSLWGWGGNNYGQLGDGTTVDHDKPFQLPGLAGIKAVAAGSYHNLALKPDGTVWAWGWSQFGQTGSGAMADKAILPTPVSGLKDVKAVVAGNHHSLALKQDGTVWAWGWNQFGQLGDKSTTSRASPVRVMGLPTTIVALAAGYAHSLALAEDGTVWAWGLNDYGQLGDGGATSRSSPSQIKGLSNLIGLAAGSWHNLAVARDGTLWAWGRNDAGQLGLEALTQRSIPGPVMGLANLVNFAAGWEHALARTSDGTVWAWGGNGYGQLGDGSNASRTRPVRVAKLGSATAVAAGESFSLAVVAGMVGAWGRNDFGQLGLGQADQAIHANPTAISGLPSIQTVAAGGAFGLALGNDGSVWA